MAILTRTGTKRKASDEPSTPDSKQKIKKARTDSPETEIKVRSLPGENYTMLVLN